MNYFIAIDQGTTGTTATLIDAEKFQFTGQVNLEFPQIYPRPGYVEHNLHDIWFSTQKSVKQVLEKFNVLPKQIIGIGITNQRETTCAFNRAGEPLSNAIVWQDRRTFKRCEELRSSGLEGLIKKKTGLTLDPYFSGTKMEWLLDNSRSVKAAANDGTLCLGTIDTYLIYKLTANTAFVTEPSNASRTLLLDLKTAKWCPELLETFNMKKEWLPEIRPSFGLFGKTQGLDFLPDGIPILGVLGDQQAALFGQACFEKGQAKCTYGTGAFILTNTGDDIQYSENGLLTTIAYQDEKNIIYALEGSCYIAGAAVQWLRDNLNFFPKSPEIESLATSVTDLRQMEHILFMPFFTGIGSPHWVSEAKGSIIGLTRDTEKKHLSRACLEGIALSINDLIQAMREDTKLPINELKVDGGAAMNNLLMNFQATISKTQIIRPLVSETTSYGAALAAAVGAKSLSYSDIPDLWNSDSTFQVNPSEVEYFAKKSKLWTEMIKRLYLSRG